MATNICKSCGKSIAGNAYTCPHCGQRYHTFLAKLFFWMIGVPLIISIVAGFFYSK